MTKRGTPIAKLVPLDDPPSLRGSVTYHITDEELVNFHMPWRMAEEVAALVRRGRITLDLPPDR